MRMKREPRRVRLECLSLEVRNLQLQDVVLYKKKFVVNELAVIQSDKLFNAHNDSFRV